MMQLRSALRLLFISGVAWCAAQGTALAAEPGSRSAERMVLEPSTTSVAGGKAKLTTTALHRQAGKYLGDYQIKVFPYTFKNESGTLSIGVSDAALRKLTTGSPVRCLGTAVTNGTGKTHQLTVVATPAGAGSLAGKLVITIMGDRGPVVFNPSYRLVGE